jgi:high-affinity Fe2+/Pb2+ permease
MSGEAWFCLGMIAGMACAFAAAYVIVRQEVRKRLPK